VECAEEDRRKGDLKALYEVTWRLSGYFQSSCKLMKNVAQDRRGGDS